MKNTKIIYFKPRHKLYHRKKDSIINLKNHLKRIKQTILLNNQINKYCNINKTKKIKMISIKLVTEENKTNALKKKKKQMAFLSY
mmetsp:Transcript_2687/g.6199  ORF Transcript_2687/g.6199 Transcript_2687/m.6199 type:complete len:85 (+) Transcript_2687:344-598(+)